MTRLRNWLLTCVLATLPVAGLYADTAAPARPFHINAPGLEAPPQPSIDFSALPPFSLPAADARGLQRALSAQERHTDSLLRQSGILGTGVGVDAAGNPVIKVYLEESAASGGIPAALDGVEVAVEYIGRIYALNVDCDEREPGNCYGFPVPDSTEEPGPREYHPRPVPIGISSGHFNVTSGTLACRVSRGCHNYALSNAHVFANENAGLPGDNILQPGRYDGGINPDDSIGQLAETVPIIMSTIASNRVDAAIALVSASDVGNATPSNGYGLPRRQTLNPVVGMNVMKYGRTSGLTQGYIDAINVTVLVTYRGGDARFIGQMVIRPSSGSNFSRPGDSGSLVVASGGAQARRPVGLLFASGTGISIANPINEVLSQLDIDIDGQ